MRAILALLGIAALAVVVLMALGMLRIEQQENASFPKLVFHMEGGKLPSFKAQTGSIAVGTTNKTMELPTVEMKNTTIQLPTIEVHQATNTQAPAETAQ
ncbi:MAG: hypothetical protein ACOY45_10795 [Pseudomonadota bacterium]